MAKTKWTNTTSQVSLRGYERPMSMDPTKSDVIVHSLLIQTPIEPFLQHLPEALANTYNRFPRMRALQRKDVFATAQIAPHIALKAIYKKSLLGVLDVTHDDILHGWEKHAEREANKPFDRFTQFPYKFDVWVNRKHEVVRLMLFSDHYMSDGTSGMTIVDNILSHISARDLGDTIPKVVTLPLQPSLYELWLRQHRVRTFFKKLIIRISGKAAYKSSIKKYTPVITPQSDLEDFKGLPLPSNYTYFLFASGTKENKDKAIAACKREKVTMGAAMMAALIVAYYNHRDAKDNQKHNFKISLGSAINMRPRLPEPLDQTDLGFRVIVGVLESLSEEGVNMDKERFWDVARRCKREHMQYLEKVSAPFEYIFCDMFMHNRQTNKFFEDLHVKGSYLSDVGLSNMGRYAHPTVYSLSNDKEMHVQAMHFVNTSNCVEGLSNFYTSTLETMHYGYMYKMEEDKGKAVFDTIVQVTEGIGQIPTDESMRSLAECFQ